MGKFFLQFIFTGFLGLIVLPLIGQPNVKKPEATLDSKLSVTTDPEVYKNVFVMLRDKADLSGVSRIKGKENKTEFVYEKLMATAHESQKNLIQFLKEKEVPFKSFYIVNGIALKANQSLLDQLRLFPEISTIMEDGVFMASEVKETRKEERSVEWGINKIKARQVWNQGFRGQGVVIGGQDTGYEWTHDQLKNKYRGWNGSTANHNYNWHDAIHENNPMTNPGNPCGFSLTTPCDDHNHGTHTMGTMVGNFTTDTIGVAPDAKWIGCRNMEEGYGMLSTYVECFEWFLAPYAIGDGPEDGDPSKMPHVINNSWGCPTIEGCNSLNIPVMEEAMLNLRNAGCVIVVSNGNSGGSCSTTYDPPAFFEGSFSVGATQSTNAIASFSSKGPVTFDSSNRLKPNVVAPGVGVRSSIRNNLYASFQGTSMAGPHVAGAVALIISANPNLAGEVDQIENILEQTTLPLYGGSTCGGVSGTATPNNTYGFGLIDVEKAVDRARDSLYVPLIKIDVFGYPANANKIAVLSDPVNGYNQSDSYSPSATIQLKNAFTHQVVFSASPQVWNSGATHSQSGDKVWYFDFSSYTSPGKFYVADGPIRSETFQINDTVYNEVFKTALKTFYYQRCGVAKESCCAHAGYADNACHLQDTLCKFYAAPSQQSRWKDMHGGWHDAGDYNKYVNFAYSAVFDLSMLYHLHPEACLLDVGIPESGNGIPDVLDEVKHELDWLLKMQDTDGGVYCMVGVANFATASPPSADMADRLYGPKTTSASFSAAAMLAMGSLQFRKIDNPMAQVYSATLLTAAENAYNWAVNNAGVTFYNAGVIGAGEQEIDAYETTMRRICSAIFLYARTGNSVYKTYVEANYTQSHLKQWNFVYPFENPTQISLLHYASLAGVSSAVSVDIRNTYKNSIENSGDNLPAHTNLSDAYKAYLTNANYTWGSNRNKMNMSNLYKAYKEYRLAPANDNTIETITSHYLHYIHGRNPIGLCYLTNMEALGADRSINTVYHGWFEDGNASWDDVRSSTYGPAPGFLSGGPNPGYSLDGCCNTNTCGGLNALCQTLQPPTSQPIQKAYLDWNTGWPQNSWQITEPAIYYQAAYVLSLAEKINTAALMALVTPLVEVSVGEIYLENYPSTLILKSDSGNYYKISIDNNGVLTSTSTTLPVSGSTRVENASMAIVGLQKGILMKAPNQQIFRLSVNGQGGVQTENVASPPTLQAKVTGSDLVINQSSEGVILKDYEGRCYLLYVLDSGVLVTKVISCF